jgi:hypothetical protein
VLSRLRRRLLREAWEAAPDMEAEKIRARAIAAHPEAAESLRVLAPRRVRQIVAGFKQGRK